MTARIAGIVSAWPPAKAKLELDGMLRRFSMPRAGARSRFNGQAAIGAVSNGSAPVAARGPISVALDGFIFNAQQLASVDVSMAEVFLELYERHGFEGSLKLINGDFAVALYDNRTGTLCLARDRFGIKPLYYFDQDDVFAFSSQPRGLLGLPNVSRSVNRRFVALFAGSHYRTFDNAPDESPFADISQLPAGHMVELQAGSRPRKSRYWDLIQDSEFSGSEEALAEEYRELLVDAVRLRLGSARSPAFTLSGGMDSSSVLASAVHTTGRKQHAFSSVYEDRTYDESKEIHSMLESSVEEWHPIKLGTPDIFRVVGEMVEVHDEPVATATWLSHYMLCKEAASQGFGALFGGLGGDELNAGEYEYFFFHFADIRRSRNEKRLRREVKLWAAYHDHPIYRKNMEVVDDALSRLVDLSSTGVCRADRSRLERYAATLNREFFDLREFSPVMDNPYTSYLRNRTYQDIFRETAPCCLRAEDRQTSVFGLQHFDPFFDHRLVEFMFRIPGRMKIREGVTKYLLRLATKGLLPEETRTRVKKTGWNAPAHIWFSDQRLEDLRDLVDSKVFKERGIYNVAEVRRIIDEHEDIIRRNLHRENHMMFLWQLLNLEIWLRSLHAE